MRLNSYQNVKINKKQNLIKMQLIRVKMYMNPCRTNVQGGVKMELRRGNAKESTRGAKTSPTGHFERIMTVIIRAWTELNCPPPNI